ncbi:hypothetical protein GCM10011428_47740 [Streptomyces violaceus]
MMPPGLTNAKRQPSRRATVLRPDAPRASSAAHASGVPSSAPAAGAAAEASKTDLRVTDMAALPH